MAHRQVVEILEAHVRAAWPHTAVYAEDEQGDAPADLTSFLVMSFPWSRTEQETVGEIDGATFVEEGAMTLTLALSRGGGVREGRLWLDTLAEGFRGRRVGEVWCSSPQSPVLDDDGSDKAYVRLIMAVPYSFGLLG